MVKKLILTEPFKLSFADMATGIDVRLLVWKAASLKDSNKNFIKESSMAKLFASDIAKKVLQNVSKYMADMAI